MSSLPIYTPKKKLKPVFLRRSRPRERSIESLEAKGETGKFISRFKGSRVFSLRFLESVIYYIVVRDGLFIRWGVAGGGF